MTNSQRIIDIQFEIERLSKSAKIVALQYKEISEAKYHGRRDELPMLETKLREFVSSIADLRQEQTRIEKGRGIVCGGYNYKDVMKGVYKNRTEE